MTMQGSKVLTGSIARRLSIAFVILGVIATLFSTTLQVYQNYQSEIQLVNDQLDKVRETHASSIAASVWSISEKQIQVQLQGLLNTPGFDYVEIRMPNGDFWSSGDKLFENMIVKQISLDYSALGSNREYGVLLIQAGKQAIYDRVSSQAINTVVNYASWISILAICQFLIFRHFVTRHLNHLATYTSTMLFDGSTEKLVLSRRSSPKGAQDELDQVVSAINSMRDIVYTSMKETLLSEARFRTLVENAPEAIVVLDLDRNFFIDVNKNAQILYGLTENELLERSPEDLSPTFQPDGRDSKIAAHHYISKTMGGEPQTFNWTHLNIKTGKEVPCEVRLAKLPSTEKNILRGSVVDITERTITEEALRRSQKMDAIGQLTGGIAHDFNNILGIIVGNLELLGRQVERDRNAINRVHTINKAANRAIDLTKQLLSFARKQEVKVEPSNINQLILNMDSLLVRSITPEVEVSRCLSEDLWLTDISPGDFEDVLLNLTINARDAMPEGGILTLETCNSVLDEAYCKLNPECSVGEYVQLIVGDNGAGMKTDILEHIFEPFFTSKPQGKGTGLGLAMVFGFVKRSRGHIKVYSEIGIGTTFRLYLPRIICNEVPFSAIRENSPMVSKKNEIILAVDDEEDLLSLAQETLQSLGYKVLTASDGQRALKILTKNPSIELLFSDVVMPGGLNGYELAELAKKQYPHIEILLTSGYTEKAVKYSGQEYFDANLLSKPYSQSDLANKIGSIFRESHKDL